MRERGFYSIFAAFVNLTGDGAIEESREEKGDRRRAMWRKSG
jgi:hypothetical protein